MEKKVLVVLRRDDRIDDAVSFLRDIVDPGTKVVFLFPYPVEPWPSLPEYCDDAETGRAATLMAGELVRRCSWERQKNLAEQEVARVRQALQSKDVEVAGDLYTGTARRAIRDYTLRGEFHWIVTPIRGSEWIGSSIRKTIAGLRGSRRSPIRALYVCQNRYAHS